MQRIILAPDSFKGALSAIDFCKIAKEEISAVFPACEICAIPIADGGEGTVDSFLLARGGTKVTLPVSGPFGSPVMGFYGRLPDGTAVLEMAAAAGLPLAAQAPNPAQASTYGVGQLLRHAAAQGAKRILLGLGGSATNDGGCGLAAALGVVFLDQTGAAFVPTGATLKNISAIDPAPAQRLLSNVSLEALCDVTNPLYGPQGAAFVFAPQKGADAAMTERLDEGLRHYGALLEGLPRGTGVCQMASAGAAGGLGAGLCALLGARLQRGIDLVLDAAGFDALLPGCDLILTGEGRFDGQSLGGKALMGVCQRAKGVPVVALTGAALGDEAAAYRQGLTALFPINRQLLPLEAAMAHTGENLRFALRNLLRLLSARA